MDEVVGPSAAPSFELPGRHPVGTAQASVTDPFGAEFGRGAQGSRPSSTLAGSRGIPLRETLRPAQPYGVVPRGACVGAQCHAGLR